MLMDKIMPLEQATLSFCSVVIMCIKQSSVIKLFQRAFLPATLNYFRLIIMYLFMLICLNILVFVKLIIDYYVEVYIWYLILNILKLSVVPRNNIMHSQ